MANTKRTPRDKVGKKYFDYIIGLTQDGEHFNLGVEDDQLSEGEINVGIKGPGYVLEEATKRTPRPAL